jgi:hypothetical protein
MGAVRIDKYKTENTTPIMNIRYGWRPSPLPDYLYYEYMIWLNHSSDYAYYENMIWIKPHPLTTPILNIWFGWSPPPDYAYSEYMILLKLSPPPTWQRLFWIYNLDEAPTPPPWLHLF